MKKFKILASVMLVMMMVLSMMVPAMAGTITIDNTVAGETYSAYKIFDVTTIKNSEGNNTGYAYTIESDSAWYNIVADYAKDHPTELTLTETADSNDNTYIVNMPVEGVILELNAATFAAYLIQNLGEIAADADADADSEETVINVDKAGYYLVDSTFGALCVLNTAADDVEVVEKNAKPSLAKTVKEDSTGTYGASASADIGQTVEFKLTVNVGTEVIASLGTGNDENFVITDILPAGMTYVADSVTISDWTVETDYTVGYENDVLTITLMTNKLKTLASATDIVIDYKATLDSDAVVESTGNINTATLTYSKFTTEKVSATVYTYEFDVIKVDGSENSLAGAKFELYDASTAGNKIPLVKVSEGEYRRATPGEAAAEGFVSAVIEAGTARVYGLDDLDDTTNYYLEEIEAPAGYNALKERVKVTAVKNSDDSNGQNDPQKVVNNTGTELPSTGGIGTTIFYCAGAILAVGAFVLLITKKRMSREM